jgi:RNA polymerase sigma-70 factor (ECF subfamily)
MIEMSDESLISRIREAADQDSLNALFAEMFNRYNSRVIGWCYKVTGDRERAADLAQEVFLKAFRHMQAYRRDSRFSTWLYVITRNHCYNSLKKWSTEPLESGEQFPTDLQQSDELDLLEVIERNRAFERTWTVIASALTPVEARVVFLHFGYEIPIKTITRQLMLSNPSGAKAHIVNARRKLKAAFGVNGSGPPAFARVRQNPQRRSAACSSVAA